MTVVALHFQSTYVMVYVDSLHIAAKDCLFMLIVVDFVLPYHVTSRRVVNVATM